MTTRASEPPTVREPSRQRAHPRVPVRFPVWARSGMRSARIEATNLGLGGLHALSEQRFALASHLRVSFDVAHGRGERIVAPLELDAVVVHCEPHSGVPGAWSLGLSFPHEDPRARDRLAHYIETWRSDS